VKRLDESLNPPPGALGIVERLGNLPDVRLEIVGQIQQPAALGRQMAEMERPFLRPLVRRRANGEHRSADNAALDLGAGVDTNRGSGVIHRVEEIVPRLASRPG
jgi:hypothetical protein